MKEFMRTACALNCRCIVVQEVISNEKVKTGNDQETGIRNRWTNIAESEVKLVTLHALWKAE